MVTEGCNNDAQAFFKKDAPVIIRMRGLPFDCTAEDVLQFFEHGENSVKVKDGKDGVLFVKNPDGRPAGDALVLFAEEDMASKALTKHNKHIGSRYIELYRITTPEIQRLVSWSMGKTHPDALLHPPPDLQVITSGTDKNCLRLRGLPFEVQIDNIIEFLGEHANNIIPQGVHLVYTDEGMPSGEAFIQMNSCSSAFNAAQEKHFKFMLIGRKCRYIEVIQCSGDDMSRILAEEQSAPSSAVSPVARIQSPLGSISPALSLPPRANASNSSAEIYPVTAAASPLPPQQPHQDKIWLMNYLVAAQQQQQAAALYQQLILALAKNVPPPWPPNPSTLLAQDNHNLTYPSLFPTAPEPFFYINIPPPQPQAAAAKLPQYSAGYPQYVTQPYPSLSPQLYLPSIPPPVTAPNPVLDLKRSWDQAFPGTDINGNLVKRPNSAQAATAPFHNNANNSMAGYTNTPGFYSPM